MPTRLKILLVATFITMIIVFPAKVHAESFLEIHRLNVDDDGNEYWTRINLFFEGSFSDEEKYMILFKNLLEDEETNFIPPDIKVLDIYISQDVLAVNVSMDIKGYNGSYMESRIAGQIIKTALSIPNIKSVTLFIENNLLALPEGIIIDEVSEWQDLI